MDLEESTPPPAVRRAAPDDFAAVAALLAELGRPKLLARTREAARAIYLRHVCREDTASLLAEVDGRTVGFMSLEFRERLNQVRPQAWIPDLIVTESARGLGAGKALLLRGFELARERGCFSVTLESAYSRHVAHQLYRSAGMIDDGLYFTLRLEHPGRKRLKAEAV
jgi:GNAT superfamily N-acetyltransferase